MAHPSRVEGVPIAAHHHTARPHLLALLLTHRRVITRALRAALLGPPGPGWGWGWGWGLGLGLGLALELGLGLGLELGLGLGLELGLGLGLELGLGLGLELDGLLLEALAQRALARVAAEEHEEQHDQPVGAHLVVLMQSACSARAVCTCSAQAAHVQCAHAAHKQRTCSVHMQYTCTCSLRAVCTCSAHAVCTCSAHAHAAHMQHDPPFGAHTLLRKTPAVDPRSVEGSSTSTTS